MRHVFLIVVVGSIAATAHGQGHLYSVGEGIGWHSTAAVVGDANGDGIADFVISHESGGHAIEVRSGVDGAVILVIPTAKATEVAAAGDVDKDGEVDFVAGYFLAGSHPTYGGHAWVMSAVDGALIHDHPGGVNDHYLGLRVGGGGVDLDQDGFDDYLVRADGESRAHSGANGAVLQNTLHAAEAAGLAGVGDVDGDGFDDWAVGTGTSAGAVRVLSGADGEVLVEVFGKKEHQQFGYAIARSADLDGDDRPDLLVGMPGDNTKSFKEPGRARILSGASGATIRTWKGAWNLDAFGRAVGAAGDIDGDGVQDVLVGAPFDRTAGDGTGRVIVYSGSTGKTLFSRLGSHTFCSLGKGVGALGDIDADGVPDILADRKGDKDVHAVVSAYSGWGAEFQIGTGVAGAIDQLWKHQPTDVDELFFAGVAGQKLKIDFELLSGDLKPRIAVVNAAGKTLEQLSFGKNSPPKSYVLKRTGHYRLRIRGLKDAKGHHTKGEYRVGTDCTFKGSAAPQSVVRKGKPGKTLVVKFDALPGATLGGTIVPVKYDGPLPAPTLKMPGGASFDLGKFATLEADGTITLADIPLATLGRHELRISTAPNGKSKVLFDLDLVQPKGTGSVDAY